MHVAFLDASKAFDRVNRQKLLLKLESRGVPKYILRLLSNELIGQYTCVRWGSTHSDFFPIGNGVKQGGILSPLLFNVYMDNLRGRSQLSTFMKAYTAYARGEGVWEHRTLFPRKSTFIFNH